MTLTAAQRRALSPSRFACPSTKKFPLDTKKRIANAHARWHNPLTKPSSRCPRGHARILRAVCRAGIIPNDAACPVR